MGVEKKATEKSRPMVLVLALVMALVFALGATGCSSGGGAGGGAKGGTGGNAASQTINGYSVREYNADVDNLAQILSRAKRLHDQLEAMGDPNRFTAQEQVDKYNNLVEQYNAAADEYNAAAKAFQSKYKMAIDGTGSRPTDPDNIDLPPKK